MLYLYFILSVTCIMIFLSSFSDFIFEPCQLIFELCDYSVKPCDFIFKPCDSLVSMSSSVFVANEMLKLYFGPLFLSNYKMPELSYVIGVIDAAFDKFPPGGPFGSYVLRMVHLIEKFEPFNDTLLQLGRNNFLGPFEDCLKEQCCGFVTNIQSTFKIFESCFEKRSW